MLKLNIIIRKSVLLCISLLALFSCVEVEDQHTDAVGYLAAPALDVDVTVEDLTLTKSFDFEVQAPSVSEIHFVVKDKDAKVIYDNLGLWSKPLMLPVGTYSVDAEYGENDFGEPYFKGHFSGTIDPLDNETPALSLSLKNALVNVTVADALSEHFTPGEKISLNNGKYEASYGEWFYVPAGEDVILSLSLSGHNSNGKEVKFTHTLTSPSPKTAYMITCNQDSTDWPSISLKIDESDVWGSRIYITTPASFGGNISAENQAYVVYEALPASEQDWTLAERSVMENGVIVIKDLDPGVTYQVRARVGALVSPVVSVTPKIDGLSAAAQHTSTAGELDGTDVVSTFAKSPVVSASIDSWTMKICRKSDGKVLREESSLGTSDGSAITAQNGWPYLPVGNSEQYVLKASAVMNGQSFDFDDIAINVPETPDFSLTLSAYTSYDKYAATNGISKDLNGANNCDPSTLYNAGAKWGISTNLMKNGNYSKTIAIYVDDSAEGRTSTVTSWDNNSFYQNVSGLSWASHTHQVSFTFDNKKVTSDKKTHHITGLPYRAAPPKKSGVHAWTVEGGGIWDGTDEYAKLSNGGGGCTMTSIDFYIPQNINVKVGAKYDVVGKAIGTTFTLKLGTTTVYSTKVSSYKTESVNSSVDSEMTSSNNKIVCNNSYGLGSTHSKVYQISLEYR